MSEIGPILQYPNVFALVYISRCSARRPRRLFSALCILHRARCIWGGEVNSVSEIVMIYLLLQAVVGKYPLEYSAGGACRGDVGDCCVHFSLIFGDWAVRHLSGFAVLQCVDALHFPQIQECEVSCDGKGHLSPHRIFSE